MTISPFGSPFHQIAYVTNDFDRALETFRERGVARFLELRKIVYPVSLQGSEACCSIALARSGGLEIEIIQSHDKNGAIYSDPLSSDGEYEVRFHHLAQKIASAQALEQLRSDFHANGTALPVEGSANGMTYFYADLRDRLGHYMEYMFAIPEYWREVGDLIPDN